MSNNTEQTKLEKAFQNSPHLKQHIPFLLSEDFTLEALKKYKKIENLKAVLHPPISSGHVGDLFHLLEDLVLPPDLENQRVWNDGSENYFQNSM
jgi:hypothetical protein